MKKLRIWMLALLLVCCVPLLTACDGETQVASSYLYYTKIERL